MKKLNLLIFFIKKQEQKHPEIRSKRGKEREIEKRQKYDKQRGRDTVREIKRKKRGEEREICDLM